MRINQLTAVHQMQIGTAQGLSASAIRVHEEPTTEMTVASNSVHIANHNPYLLKPPINEIPLQKFISISRITAQS
jgi:hypothetical protein